MIKAEGQATFKEGMTLEDVQALVKIAEGYSSRVNFMVGNKIINAKSLMGVMSLAAGDKRLVRITAKGEDAQQAVDALEKFFDEE